MEGTTSHREVILNRSSGNYLLSQIQRKLAHEQGSQT